MHPLFAGHPSSRFALLFATSVLPLLAPPGIALALFDWIVPHSYYLLSLFAFLARIR